MSLIKNLIKTTKNEYASVVSDGIVGDNCGFIDTGSCVLNALISGSIFGGVPSNKVTAFAGESGVGKSFYVMEIIKHFLKENDDGIVMLFESESAFTQEMFIDRGLDVSRIGFLPVETIQQFRHQAMKILTEYGEQDEDDRPPMMMCLDSLGNLSTTKELEDIESGKETRDMTRSQLIRGAFRALTLKLGKLNVPMILTNHTYEAIGNPYADPVMAGGKGLVYAASTIIYLSKAREKEGSEVVGAILTATTNKSRLTREKQKVKTRLFFDTGLDRYYGMLDLAIEAGIWKKVSTRIELDDGTKVWGKDINEDPEKYFTDDVLELIDVYCKAKFTYGKGETDVVTDNDED